MSQSLDETPVPGVDVTGPTRGKPVVFLHGVLFTRKLWAPQREALSDEFRVIVPDLPGHGDRSAEQFRMDGALQIVDDVVERVAGGEAALVGLSLGGYVATAYAQRHPEKVDALVVSGSSANPVGTLGTLTRIASGVSDLATKSELVRRGLSSVASGYVERLDLPPEIESEILDSGFYPAQFGRAGFDLAGNDFRQMFAAYPGPALVCNGQWDLLNRLGEDEHAAAATAASVTVFEGAGHVCNLERPEEFVAAVRHTVRETAE